MKYKLEDEWIKLIKTASNTVLTAYDKEIDGEGYIEVDALLQLIEDLNEEVKHIQEEFDDFKNSVEDDYVPRYKDYYELYEVDRNDF